MRFERTSDRVVIGGIIGIIALSPFAFGSVYRAAFATLEAVSFALFAVCMIKRSHGTSPAPPIPNGLRLAALPGMVLLVVIAGQLIPLPPRVMRAITPATYQLNRMSLPGWPALAPYQGIAILGSPSSASGDVREKSALGMASASQWEKIAHAGVSQWRWRAVAIAPTVVASGLIEWLALGAIFVTITLYPFGLVGEREPERGLYRAVILSILLTGSAVASVGLLQRAWWNGKLLWFWAPQDWGGPLLAQALRASGPFVDPDHFANYLAMVLPLAIMASLFPLKIVQQEKRANLRLAAVIGSLIMGFALLFSLSRAGWASAIVGVGVALMCANRAAREMATSRIIAKFRISPALLIPIAIAASVAIMLFFAGSRGREAIDARLNPAHNSMYYRPTVWRDTLKLMGDFPLFGVGLGCWPEFFPHYRRPPWSPFFFREAENDYLQLIAEIGLLGGALVIWLGIRLMRGFSRDAHEAPDRHWTLISGLIGGATAMFVHEAFDFSLRTPANAWLFVILIAIALRVAAEKDRHQHAREMRRALPSARSARYGAVFAALAAVAMIAIVYLQDGAAYPYEAPNQHQLYSIMTKLLRHPAMAESHLALAEAAAANADHELHDTELRAAVWLDPNDPVARDRYARDLLITGDQRAGLDEITRSVYRAPEPQAHYYLRPGLIPWLLPDEQAAIAEGLERAVDYQYAGARDTLAAFYRELGRYDDLGQLFEKLAIDETESSRKISDLVESGSNYARAGRATTAIAKLQEAIAINPQDAWPYAELARAVYGPNHQMEAAQAIIQEGLRAGADPYQLEIALADAGEKASNPRATEDALEAALQARPSFSVAIRLGNFYLDDQRPARAAAAFERATEIDSGSAEAWFALAQARKREFDYAAAAKAYDRAQILEPRNRYYASIHKAFERRMAQVVEDVNTRDGPQ